MSEDNKDLGDELNDMIGDAKDSAKKAGEKISQKTSELADDAKEFANEAKEKASEFANEAKNVLSEGKNVAIIAHLWLIGWIIALIMNSNKRSDFGSFYIRQMLGLALLSFLAWIPFLGWVLAVVIFVAWLMSLLGALSGEKKTTFLLGEQFQDWFKNL